MKLAETGVYNMERSTVVFMPDFVSDKELQEYLDDVIQKLNSDNRFNNGNGKLRITVKFEVEE